MPQSRFPSHDDRSAFRLIQQIQELKRGGAPAHQIIGSIFLGRRAPAILAWSRALVLLEPAGEVALIGVAEFERNIGELPALSQPSLGTIDPDCFGVHEG
jgi:hypothetical protein